MRRTAWTAAGCGALALVGLAVWQGFGGDVAAPLASDLLRSLRAAP